MYLIDTDVLSALRYSGPDARITRWFAARRTAEVYLSVVSIAEIELQILRLQSRDPDSARALGEWLDALVDLYGDRILEVNIAVARRWGQLSSDVGHEGADLLVAATALERGLTLVTFKVARFRPTGVPLLDPSSVLVTRA